MSYKNPMKMYSLRVPLRLFIRLRFAGAKRVRQVLLEAFPHDTSWHTKTDTAGYPVKVHALYDGKPDPFHQSDTESEEGT